MDLFIKILWEEDFKTKYKFFPFYQNTPKLNCLLNGNWTPDGVQFKK
jgi:hypothetical protein